MWVCSVKSDSFSTRLCENVPLAKHEAIGLNLEDEILLHALSELKTNIRYRAHTLEHRREGNPFGGDVPSLNWIIDCEILNVLFNLMGYSC